MNLTIDKKAGTVTIVMPLNAKPVASKSGKSLILASTGGNVILGTHGGKDVKVGLNVYVTA
jgi:hypothetical protein